MSDSVKLARLVVQVASTLGVSKVIADVISNNTTVLTPADTVRVWTGSIVLGSMLCDQAMKHVDVQFNRVLDWHEGRQTAAHI